MSIKEELLTWNDACEAVDNEDFEGALSLFDQIADSAKIYFNIGTVLATIQEHESAIKAYIDALKSDQYFAVAYFQKGVSSFLLGDFEGAVDDFNDALQYLRGNLLIDYKQLGLDYKLFSCEVLYNRGLCYLFMGEDDTGIADLYAAQKEKQTPDHDVIDQAIEQGIDGLSVFSLPPGLMFRPPEAKVKNAQKVDYLGSAKLIAAVERTDMFTGFKGAHMRKMTNVTAGTDMASAPASMLSRANTTVTRSSAANSLNDRSRRRSRSIGNSEAPSTASDYSPRPRRGTDASLDSGSFSRSGSITRLNSAPSPRFPQRSMSQASLRPPPRAMSDTSSFRGSIYSTASGSGKLRVKCHFNDTLMVVCDQGVTYAELVAKIQQKYNAAKPLRLKYKDEDNELVLMTDDDDLELAKSLAGKPDRLDVWCFE